MINKQLFYFFLATILSLVFTYFFWDLFDLTTKITPYLDERYSNLEKYNLKYSELMLNQNIFLTTLSENYFQAKSDIGYTTICYIFIKFGLSFDKFLFLMIFLTYFTFITIYQKIIISKDLIVFLIFILLATFWMEFGVGAALRQSISIIILFYCLFISSNQTLAKKILTILLASTIHLSAIIFLPYLIFEKIFIKRIELVSFYFVFFVLLYIFDLNIYISEFIIYFSSFFNFDLRALKDLNHPTAGFSTYKLLATVIPFLLFMIIFSFKKDNVKKIEKKIFLFYLYPSFIGLALSQMSYYDRILLYSWSFSPFLVICFFQIIYMNFIISTKRFLKLKN